MEPQAATSATDEKGGATAGATAHSTAGKAGAAGAVPLRFRAKGTLSFTGRGALAWVPAPVVNGLGSSLAGQLLRLLAPKLLAAVAADYAAWAKGEPRKATTRAAPVPAPAPAAPGAGACAGTPSGNAGG